MSIAYNLLLPQDAQLLSYEVEEEQHYRCQIITIIGMTESGYTLVITKLDTSLIAILADTYAKEIHQEDYAPAQMTAEEILARIGFLMPVKEEVLL